MAATTTPLRHREPFSAAASPVPGYSPSRASDLSRGATEISDVASASLESDIASLRRGLEDTRAIAREVQRQQKQENRNWRSELEAAVEGLRSKLSSLVERETLEKEVQELRAASDRRHTEVSKEINRRAGALETSLASARTEASIQRKTSSLEDGERSSQANVSQISLGDAQWEIRMGTLEQQTTKLSVQLAGLAQPSLADAETSTALHDAVRRAETAERRAAAVETAHDRIHERYAKLAQDVHSLHDVVEAEHERTINLQQSFDELRDRNSAGLNTSAANLNALDATVDASAPAWAIPTIDGVDPEKITAT